jgi:hypothetical protein
LIGNKRKNENLFSPGAREKPRFFASFGMVAGIGFVNKSQAIRS